MYLQTCPRKGFGGLSYPWVNAFCYAKFAFRAVGAEPPPFVEERCAALV